MALSEGKQKEAIKMFAQMGRIYQQESSLLKGDFEKACQNWVDALKFFLRNYAFERQGRSPLYSGAAIRAINEATKNTRKDIPSDNFPNLVWRKFCKIITGSESETKGTNKNNNPLNSEDKEAVTQIIRQPPVSNNWNYNLVKYIIHLLKAQEIKKAHKYLWNNIRGIGPKISSFFLRDIMFFGNITEPQDPELAKSLQPIDLWVRRITQEVFDIKDKSDEEIASILTAKCKEHNVSIISFNQGAWYFGSKIFATYAGGYKLQECLSNKQRLVSMIKEYLSQQEKCVSAVRKCIKNLQRESRLDI